MSTICRNPQWWSQDYDEAWKHERSKFRRDWRREPELVYAMGSHQSSATMRPAVSTMPAPGEFERLEPAFRFGFGAQRYYAEDYPEWNAGLAEKLHRDWADTGLEDWNQSLNAIRRGWTYAAQQR